MQIERMFYVLKVHWLSCNNSCTESSRPFELAKNWFLKRRLDNNMCQVLIDVKYTKDWQLGLNKNLQDWLVKPIIFTTQKVKFFVKDLFNKCEQILNLMRTCSHLLKKLLTERFIFVHWFMQVNRQNTVKKKITFYKNNIAFLFTFFSKVLAIFKFFTARCLDVRFWALLSFICLKFNPQHWYLLRREKMCWFSSYF